jgi:Mn-dependent DtxR family transcriptional regulator
LAKLLGVRWEAVTQAEGKLQKQQLISHSRGHLTILNRAEIEAIACSCYGIIKAQEDSFLG